MYVYGGSGWQAAGSSVNGTSERATYTATAGQTTFASTYDPGYVDVYLNGVKLIVGTDFTATSGTSIVLTTGAAVGDTVDIVAYGTFVVADTYTKTQADARYVEVAGDTMTGDLNVTGGNVGIGTSSPSALLHLESAGPSIKLVDSDNNPDYEIKNGNGSFRIIDTTAGSDRINISSAGNVGIGTNSPEGQLHLYASSVGAPAADADDFVIEKTGDTGLSILSTTTGRIYFGDAASNDQGSIRYVHTDNSMRFETDSSEAARLDASGNLLLGKLSASSTTAGFQASQDGQTAINRSGTALQVGRLSSDGSIIDLRKDGTTVGSIGNASTNLIVEATSSNRSGLSFGGSITPRRGGASSDSAVDLGTGSYRFKDLYLSGGVVETTTTVTYASSIALSYDNGSIQTVTLTGNVTFTDSLADGEAVVLMLNAGASHTVTWTAVNKWVTSGGNVAPTLTANDTLVFWKIGSTVYGAYAGSYT
jgi:hypothetical protein